MSEPLCFDHADPLLAAAAWSTLTEPDDAVAALVVTTWGQAGALDRLVHWDRSDNTGHSAEVPAKVRRDLLDRTRPRLDGLDPRPALDRLAELGGRAILPGDAKWPRGLKDLTAPPHLLWARGEIPRDVVEGGGVAIVGCRTATVYGQNVAADLAIHLAGRGITTVSGGAFGIDIAAHRGALVAGGRTIAILAGGLNHLYPRAHTGYFEQIVKTGALISELPPDAEPRRYRFLSRNRLIAAMSAGTVVVEAGLRSGALNTARHARELGRHLGAVPGAVTSMMSAGSHELIREGATLITDGEDVREMVTDLVTLADDPVSQRQGPDNGLLDGLSPHCAQVVDALPVHAAREPAQIAHAAGISLQDTLAALGVLEMTGRVERAGSGFRRAAVRRR